MWICLGQDRWPPESKGYTVSSLVWHKSSASSLRSPHLRACPPHQGSVLSGRACLHSCHSASQEAAESSLFQEIIYSPWHIWLFEEARFCFSCIFWFVLLDHTLGKVPTPPYGEEAQTSCSQIFWSQCPFILLKICFTAYISKFLRV